MSPTRPPNRGRRQSRPSTGDFTGRVKVTTANDQKKAVEERGAEISMQNAADARDELEGVFDAQSQQRIDSPGSAHTVSVVDEDSDDESDEESEGPSQPPAFLRRNQEPVLTGQEDVEVIDPILAQRKTFTPPTVLRSSTVIIRVDADVEKMTYGMRNGEPNNYDFKEGMQYSVPFGVAEHLNERGLVRQWISG